MPRATRSNELLTLVDGLFFINDDVIDLAATFYNELRTISANFSDEAIEKLVPHVVSLLSRLNDLSKENNELTQEIASLRDDLSQAQERCVDLNMSFKGKSRECCEIEDQYEAETRSLQAQLSKCRQENEQLKATVEGNPTLDTAGVIAECQEKVATLTTERQCLITTIQTLEADLKCLRSELPGLETQVKRARTSDSSNLLTELAAAETAKGNITPAPISITHPDTDSAASTSFSPTPSGESGSSSVGDEHRRRAASLPRMKDVLIIGDSHLRYSTKPCLTEGAYVECCPGGKITDIKNVLLSYVGVSLSVIYLHVGCNNLRKGYRGGSGYNGGHGKREALHCMADLLFSAKTQFPKARTFLNRVLVRRDISYKSLLNFNDQLELMCINFNVTFVEANCCVGRRDLSRDGVHFSRRGVSQLGSLFVNVITEALQPPLAGVDPSAGRESGAHELACEDLPGPRSGN